MQELRLIHLTRSVCAPADASPIAVFGSRAQDNDCGAGSGRLEWFEGWGRPRSASSPRPVPPPLHCGSVPEAVFTAKAQTRHCDTKQPVRLNPVMGGPARESLRGLRARQHPAAFSSHEGGTSGGARGPGNFDYTQIPEGHHGQENGIDPVPAVGRDRPRRPPACRSRGDNARRLTEGNQ